MSINRRGRWGQYQVLCKLENMKPYLLKTELFNEHSFYRNLHRQLFIRPCFGSSEIIVSEVEGCSGLYKVQFEQMTAFFKGRIKVFHFLKQVCKTNQFYILQDADFLYTKHHQVIELFVTVQHDITSSWKVKDVLDKNGLTDGKISWDRLKKIHEVAISAACSLVEDPTECSTVVVDFGLLAEELWIRDIELHSSKSKWSQYQILSSIRGLSSYLPKTHLATQQTIFQFIEKDNQLILKPASGQWGIGVVEVSRLTEGIFELHNERNTFTLMGSTEFMNYLQTHYFSKERYLVQERIALAKIDDCVMDARVMVQREDSEGNWEITAKVAKVATKGFIVTNVAKSILLLEEALQKIIIRKRKRKKILSTIDKICMLAAVELGRHYPEVTRIGLDVGIDKRGKIWIFETNLVPDVSLFKRLPDKSIYNRIIKKKEEDEV